MHCGGVSTKHVYMSAKASRGPNTPTGSRLLCSERAAPEKTRNHQSDSGAPHCMALDCVGWRVKYQQCPLCLCPDCREVWIAYADTRPDPICAKRPVKPTAALSVSGPSRCGRF